MALQYFRLFTFQPRLQFTFRLWFIFVVLLSGCIHESIFPSFLPSFNAVHTQSKQRHRTRVHFNVPLDVPPTPLLCSPQLKVPLHPIQRIPAGLGFSSLLTTTTTTTLMKSASRSRNRFNSNAWSGWMAMALPIPPRSSSVSSFHSSATMPSATSKLTSSLNGSSLSLSSSSSSSSSFTLTTQCTRKHWYEVYHSTWAVRLYAMLSLWNLQPKEKTKWCS